MMTTFLWIMLGGFLLGLVSLIVFSMAKIRLGIILSIVVSIACVMFFVIDISLNPIKNTELVSQNVETADLVEMVHEYRANEVRAKETYFDNRYMITAEIESIKRAGLREGYVGYNVYFVVPIDDETLRVCANFQSDMKDEILQLEVGDVLTFTGDCVSPDLWYACSIVEVE